MHSIAALKIYGKFLLGRKFLGTTKKCHLEKGQFFDWNTFFQKNVKKKNFLEGRGRVKKIIFYYFANGVINILP